MAEEVIAGIYLVAALLAWNGGLRVLAIALFSKAAWDTGCSWYEGVMESIAEIRQKQGERPCPPQPRT